MAETKKTARRSRDRQRVCIPVPWLGFDPTEVAVPYKILSEAGVDVTFATPDTKPANFPRSTKDGEGDVSAAADPIMVTGVGLYLLKWSMRADANGIDAYTQCLVPSGLLAKTVPYSSLNVDDYDALLLPGGHCQDMRPYLEDVTLQAFVKKFSEDDVPNTDDQLESSFKPIAAVCHGVVLAGRSGALQGRSVTALPSWMESLAHNSTWLWMGDYYKTYPKTSVEKEVTECAGKYQRGPLGLTKDAPVGKKGESLVETIQRTREEGKLANDAEALVAMAKKSGGFVVKDGKFLTARWPGDCHSLGYRLLAHLVGRGHVIAPPPGKQ